MPRGYVHKSSKYSVIQLTAYDTVKKVIQQFHPRKGRRELFQALANELKLHFRYDRLCISLYDSAHDVISLFTAEEGTVVKAYTQARHLRGSISELAIASRKPVFINSIEEHFAQAPPLLAEAGLNATLVVPLSVGEEMVGTLHCSFADAPSDMMDILNFLMEVGPALALCLRVILQHEACEENMNHRLIPMLPPGEDGIAELFNLPDIRHMLPFIHRVSRLNIPVLISGETGTGKSTLARYSHAQSQRAGANFIKVNCPALAPTLFESELFGHARGAFTGANTKRIGRLEMAQGGTLFLDEIAELPVEMQSKLLHVLEEQAFERVGESAPVSVDVRLVSATNVDLKEALAQRRLRQDMFYRLAAVVIDMPPLRKRRNDIPYIADFLMRRQAQVLGLNPVRLDAAAHDELQNYSWPGNIRELRNVVNRLLIYSSKEQAPARLVQEIIHENLRCPESPEKTERFQPQDHSPDLSLQAREKQHIEEVLRLAKGRLSGPRGAAELLGMARSTLQYRMRKLGIR